MAQVIELFGAPGSGKTSLARALDGVRLDGRRFVAAERLMRVPRRGPALPPRPARRAAAGRSARVLERLLRRDLTPAERRAALASCSDELRAAAALLAAGPGAGSAAAGAPDADDPIGRLQRSEVALNALLHRTLADRAADDVIVVLDEGLLQRVRLLGAPGAAEPDDVTLGAHLARLPVALLHVHVHAAPDAVAARLAERGRVIARHAALDEAQRAASVAADAALYARVARLLAVEGRAALLEVDTGAVPPAAAAERIVAALTSRVR